MHFRYVASMKSTPCYLPDLTHCLCIELYIIYEAALVLQNFILKHVVYPRNPISPLIILLGENLPTQKSQNLNWGIQHLVLFQKDATIWQLALFNTSLVEKKLFIAQKEKLSDNCEGLVRNKWDGDPMSTDQQTYHHISSNNEVVRLIYSAPFFK